MLRANLKRMSNNMDTLIDKMKQQSLRRTKGMFHPEDLLVDESQDETVSTVASHIAAQRRGNLPLQQSMNLSVNASTHGSQASAHQ